MIRKTYVGYDLGDGESITDVVTLEKGKSTSKTDFNNMTMPDTTIPGQAMPTIFAFDENGDVIFSQTITADPEAVSNIIVNFKRRPSDLLRGNTKLSIGEQIDLVKKSSKWPGADTWPGGNGPEMLTFKNSVIAFTNGIFTDKNYVNRLKSAAQDSDEIVFCVGHPTNWSELDVAIYELIIKNTVLGSGVYEGKKSSIIMEAESRAAFLYAKDIAAFGKLPKDSSVLLIDVGSSTIDITAMAAMSNNYQYNSGSNYLGARSIDFMIRNWYLEKIKKQPASWAMYQSLVRNNPTIANALTLSCRRAKEQLYSSPSGKSVITFGLFPGVRLEAEELDRLIESTPIADILRETINLNDAEYARMGRKSWKELFKDFLTERKSEMTRAGIRVGHIILTGSASKMPFVPQIVLAVFNEVHSNSIEFDMDPSRTISKGLALVGPSNIISSEFQKDLNNLIDQKLEKIVEKNIHDLGKNMGKIIADILTPKMKGRVKSWRSGDISTIRDMNKQIQSDCSEANLTKLLTNDSKYVKAVEDWLKNKVGKDIALELKVLCDKYGVRDINLEDLNIMTMPTIGPISIPIDPLEFIKIIGVVVSIIAGVVAASSAGTILGIVVVIISIISDSLAVALFTALMAMGPAGVAILTAVIGVAAATLVKGGFDNFKNTFSEKVLDWNLPGLARKLITDNKINQCFAEANLPGKIEDSFKDEALKKDIMKKVSMNLKGQIEKRAEDIKYAIESK
ncbi:MAG: hypothetical protein MR936_05175 [Eubacterium sp.]|nr:hypothetical protein [Eubacterium sp.]